MKAHVFTLIYKQSVEKDLRSVPKLLLQGIIQRISDLAHNPYPAGAVKLQVSVHMYRVRQGDYRIIYQVQNKELVILVVKVGHRKEVYRS